MEMQMAYSTAIYFVDSAEADFARAVDAEQFAFRMRERAQWHRAQADQATDLLIARWNERWAANDEEQYRWWLANAKFWLKSAYDLVNN
jgi:hypothetical protein